MNAQALTQSIKSIICTRVAPELEIDAIGDDARLIEDLNFDSLQILGLITELEQEFDIMLDDDDLDLESLDRVSAFASFVAAKLGLS